MSDNSGTAALTRTDPVSAQSARKGLLHQPIISPSIALRLLLGAAVILTAFVLLTAIAVRDAVSHRAEDAQFERMQGLLYGILGATDVSSEGELFVTELSLPDRELRRPGAVVSAQIYDQAQNINWQSVSTGDANPVLIDPPPVGKWHFDRRVNALGYSEFYLLFTVNWLPNDKDVYQYTFRLAEHSATFDRQMANFDRKLIGSLAVVSVLLVILLLIVQRWTMRPINRLKNELLLLEEGQAESLHGRYPQELKPLVQGLNTLLRSERARQQRYRNALGDIAHSLKTPLAVMRNLSVQPVTDSTQQELQEQLSRMQLIIDHQLKRAARHGPGTLVPFTDIHPMLERLSRALKRLRGANPPEFRWQNTEKARIRMAPDDLMECVGNLLENAVKYGGKHIHVRFDEDDKLQRLSIEDDGIGFGDEDLARLLQRGVRADTKIDGQGIGLAVVAEIMEAYEGRLELSHSNTLEGARATLYLPR